MVDKSRGDDGGSVGGGAVKLRQSYLVHGGGVCVCVCVRVGGGGRGYSGLFSHLMNRVIHWSACASAQFSCPCF